MFGGSLDQTNAEEPVSAMDAAHSANAVLRAYVQEHGDRPWTPEELGELARLRAEWTAAVRGVRLEIRPVSGPVNGSAVVTAA
ncbi:hypothetical protein [Actinacidiphila rubida]|uniref:Uncharacterized protein n=1 Tax=Actinacidiphila rubida TaxID=310780 RepID=A0A1H8DP11_9ACTN|nr:hypothetical protein [Actinacidiphila rubida]SEN08989.1 hypothetical protein SAMN05216267_1001216 [Actinacidiphila rubida]